MLESYIIYFMVMTALAVFMLNKVLLSMHHLSLVLYEPAVAALSCHRNSNLVPSVFSERAPSWKAMTCDQASFLKRGKEKKNA